MADVFTYIVDMPTELREMVTPCLDGYTIYINAKLDSDKQREAYDHALRHIMSCDWEKCDVQSIEADAHK